MNKRREMLEKRAKAIGLELNYTPIVQMEDIRELPDSFWHKSRQTGWGGSDEGVLNGLSKYKTLEELSYEKLLGVKKGVDRDSQYRFDIGHVMETPNLKLYAAIKGYKFLTYTNYAVVVETQDDVTSVFPNLKKVMNNVYSKMYRDKAEAEKILASIKEKYPNAYIEEQDSNEPKDIREITQEEHTLYDQQGIVCVDRRQYRHPIYSSMIGDCDGICITPQGDKIGIECKTYAYMYKGTYSSGVLGGEGKVKNPEYVLQVQHYMAVLNLDQFDIIASCGNSENDFSIVTVYRNPDIEKTLCENCESKWNEIQNNNIPTPNHLTKEQRDSLVDTLIVKPMKTESINLPEYYLNIAVEYQKKKDNLLILEAQAEQIKNDMYAIEVDITKGMNNTEEAVILDDDGEPKFLITNKIPKARNGVDSKKLKANYPDIYEDCKTIGDPKPSFKLKPATKLVVA